VRAEVAMNSQPGDSRDGIVEPRLRSAGACVLVVDDDREMREMVATRLTSEGYDVHEAASGAELLRSVQSLSLDRWPLDAVDLIVLDNRMPEMTGLQAIRRLRASHWETPAILMTAFPEPDVKREAAALGITMLAKPFSFDLLSIAVTLGLLSRSDRAQSHPFGVSS
jgi:CheY-like chemotaxis protein